MSRLLLILFLQVPIASYALAADVRIEGRIVDQSGLALPGATIRLVRVPAGALQTAVTAADGRYAFEVEPASYRLEVSLDGFETVTREVRATDATAVPDIVLALGHFAETTTVVAAPAKIDLQPKQFGAPATLPERVIDNAPMRTGNYRDALPLLPKVVRGPDGLISVAGARAPQGVVLLNGTPEIDVATGAPIAEVPLAAVDSLQAITTAFPAEYGESTGGVTLVNTRAGSDEFKFSVNSFDPRPRLDRQGFHGIEMWQPSVGVRGPIAKGRAWFAQSVDYLFSRTQVDTVVGAEDRRVSELTSFSQVDAKPWALHTVTAWLSVQQQNIAGPTLSAFTPVATLPTLDRGIWGGAFVDRATLGDASTLETRLEYRRQRYGLSPDGSSPYFMRHDVTVGSYFETLDRNATSLQASTVFSRAWSGFGGSHLLKAGVTAARTTLDGIADFSPVTYLRTDGSRAELVQFVGNGRFAADAVDTAAFLQDTWTVSSRLSADLGLRADHGTAVGGVVAPRAGMTLKLDEPTTVTAGAGLFTDKTPLSALAFAGYPSRSVTSFDAAGVALGAPTLYRNVLAPQLDRARAWQWSAQVDRQLSPSWQLRVGYQERRGSNELVVVPSTDASGQPIAALTSDGVSRSRSLETTMGFHPASGRFQFYTSYVRSSSRGNTNDFNEVNGNFLDPLLVPASDAPLPVDAPHRVLAWGLFSLPFKATIAPFLEVRSGFPYSPIADNWSYVGQRYGTRYPAFASLDVVVNKVVAIPGGLHALIGFKVFNLASHGSQRDIQRDIERLDYGTTYNSPGRQLRGVFEILWGKK